MREIGTSISLSSGEPEREHHVRQDEGRPEPRREYALDRWRSLAAGIRSGSVSSETEFVAIFEPGVKFLLRRQLGAVAAERLGDEVLAGAIDDIRRGWIREVRDLLHFVRCVASRHDAARPSPERFESASEKARARAKAGRVAEVLPRFSPAEQDLLRRYYVHGEQLSSLEISPAVWARLRERFLDLMNRQEAARGSQGLGEARPLAKNAAF